LKTYLQDSRDNLPDNGHYFTTEKFCATNQKTLCCIEQRTQHELSEVGQVPYPKWKKVTFFEEQHRAAREMGNSWALGFRTVFLHDGQELDDDLGRRLQ
jgi:hypothetical protein